MAAATTLLCCVCVRHHYRWWDGQFEGWGGGLYPGTPHFHEIYSRRRQTIETAMMMQVMNGISSYQFKWIVSLPLPLLLSGYEHLMARTDIYTTSTTIDSRHSGKINTHVNTHSIQFNVTLIYS